MTIDLDAIPLVDTSQHSVPLDEVVFDTFRPVKRAVPLDSADSQLIRSLLDAIPPIYEPVFESAAAAAEWLKADDIVLGYVDGDEAYAYPIKILNFHEMVSHEVNGRPILASYCPLCRSGVMYDRTVDGEVLLFGNTSALYESDMVMVDHQTGSYWMQVSGEAIVGALTGRRLTALPSQTTTWALWRAQYPHTVSLSRQTGYGRDYSRDPFAGLGEQYNSSGRFIFPVSENGRDPRLDPGEVVLGLEVEGVQKAYPLSRIGDVAVNDQIGDTAVVIFSLADGPTGAAYRAVVDGRPLTFKRVNGVFEDEQTGSAWDLTGAAVDGELAGSRLAALPARSTYWFALVAAFPDLTLYTSDE
ncbi:MAG: DUF3179 domain-containing protein [Anaerolineae bacterium]